MTDESNEAAFETLIARRGGLPESCDFCGQRFVAGRYPVPEEAGAWACNECDAKWARAEAKKMKKHPGTTQRRDT